jgi:hypothetical protein
MSRPRKERWRQIPRVYRGYEVSDRGRVRSWIKPGAGEFFYETPHIMKPHPGKRDGYLGLILVGGGRKPVLHKVHNLVLYAFVGPKPFRKAECRHLDGKVTNNRLTNLVWGTHRQNFEDQVRHGTDTRGERNGGAKLTNRQAEMIRESDLSGEELRKIWKVSAATISRIKTGKRYAQPGRKSFR